MGQLAAHFADDGVVDLRRLRGAAAREEAEGGDERGRGGLALFREEHGVEGGRSAGHRDPVAAVAVQRVRHRELLEEDCGEAVEQQHHGVVGPGYVREGEGHRADVVRGQVQGVREAGAAGDQGPVGVQDALGVGGGAGGPVDPPDVRAGGGRRRECGGVAVREVVVGLEDAARAEPPGHRGVVEAAPGPGDGEELGLGLAEREADLSVAVERDDRGLDGAEPGEGHGEQYGLDAGGELPGDDRAGADAHVVQAGGDAFGAVAQFPEGQPAVLRRVLGRLDQDGGAGGQ